ncbi:hypothetical protein [Parendozoicomonas sp. Alg238-R29]|uniref:hypothetical protein n=1 Tax=Parendozoicomonas sp. Alg238-R29 TaxID=2993446 RepID=UPI00248E30EF|nr:hypothetical protein [Parendozoicomonas sp. Alg238-R29]
MLAISIASLLGSYGFAAERLLAEELYNSANLHKNYAGWHNSMSAMLENYKKALPEEIFNKLQRRFNLLTSEKRYKRRTVRALRNNLSDTEVRVLLEWYSVGGKELSRQERLLSAESAPETPLNIWVQEQKLSSKRIQVLSLLMEETHAVDQGADFIVQSALSMAELVSQNMPEEQKLDIELIRERLTKQRQAIYQELQKVSLARFAWTYQDISDEQLEDYLSFVRTIDAQTWFEVVNRAQANMLLTGNN